MQIRYSWTQEAAFEFTKVKLFKGLLSNLYWEKLYLLYVFLKCCE